MGNSQTVRLWRDSRLHESLLFVWITPFWNLGRGKAVTYRIRLLVPACYTDEARIMIEEHPRATVVERHDGSLQPGADMLVVISSEPRILHGLHRWWLNRRIERRANPPMAIVQADNTTVTFNDHSADELEKLCREEALPHAS